MKRYLKLAAAMTFILALIGVLLPAAFSAKSDLTVLLAGAGVIFTPVFGALLFKWCIK